MAANNNDSKKPVPEDVPQQDVRSKTAPAAEKQTAEKREKAKGKKESGIMAFVRKADPIAMTCFVVFILAFAVVLGAYIDKMYISDPPAPHVIVAGDEVEVEYTGSYFDYYDKDGAVVFDTNMKNVNDDDTIFKSPSFTNKTKFDNLKFTVGGTQVLEMFGDKVIGHTKGQTVRVAIDAENGYGTQSSSDFALAQVFAKSGVLTLDEFNDKFDKNYRSGDFNGSAKKNVESPFEGITMDLSFNKIDSTVAYTYNVTATVDEAKTVTTDDNVKYTVTAYDDANKTFTVTYQLDEEKDSMFEILNSDYQLGYVYKDADHADYQFREKTSAKNGEQLGMTLYFVIKIVKVNV